MTVLLFALIPLLFAVVVSLLGLVSGADTRPGFDDRVAGDRYGALR